MDGKEKVLQTFEANSEKLTHWKIYYGYAAVQGQLAESTENYIGELDKALSRKMLVEAMDRLDPGEYLVQFKSAPTASLNIINCRFKIGHGTTSQIQQQPNMKGYMDHTTFDQLMTAKIGAMEEKFEKKLLQRKMDDLEKEIKELKKQKGGVGDLVGVAREVVAMFKGMTGDPVRQLEPRPVVVRGPSAEADAKARDKYFKDLYDVAILELFDSEGEGKQGTENGIVLLWCLNEYRKKNPDVWNSLKPTILKEAEALNKG